MTGLLVGLWAFAICTVYLLIGGAVVALILDGDEHDDDLSMFVGMVMWPALLALVLLGLMLIGALAFGQRLTRRWL